MAGLLFIGEAAILRAVRRRWIVFFVGSLLTGLLVGLGRLAFGVDAPAGFQFVGAAAGSVIAAVLITAITRPPLRSSRVSPALAEPPAPPDVETAPPAPVDAPAREQPEQVGPPPAATDLPLVLRERTGAVTTHYLPAVLISVGWWAGLGVATIYLAGRPWLTAILFGAALINGGRYVIAWMGHDTDAPLLAAGPAGLWVRKVAEQGEIIWLSWSQVTQERAQGLSGSGRTLLVAPAEGTRAHAALDDAHRYLGGYLVLLGRSDHAEAEVLESLRAYARGRTEITSEPPPGSKAPEPTPERVTGAD